MKFNCMMHVAFYTDRMDEMIAFYTEKLGATVKVCTRYKQYIGNDDRPYLQEIARNDPERIFNVYLEIVLGQFVELFPKIPNQINDVGWNERLGYSHFALTVDDIFETRRELEKRGVMFDSPISKGPSGTYQMWMHDPDGNKFEIMQYTENSYQVKGHID